MSDIFEEAEELEFEIVTMTDEEMCIRDRCRELTAIFEVRQSFSS